ncbi:hypothetical protein A3D83_00380 [Candidatus Daviesbacteria bacterium RIFCSPHIGHO2_02_FULL_41_10]|uniref:Uncharacterized protein n=2 Tax=Candidatus Daviesiibacteriota TaxID=1752718 RepID=A0A1F5ISP1_9BACT|nr:MAG: hypothetical protein A2871_00770 [Candidatus Daviesbacteria bacterium RIFCSPHIGHO2_01_FULL_41_23]OGE33438.1 MAG: hypothetical protein A3D83_00380 [Candidatus Daviesbacteria bacterium RIFCSPHIGHO2_02_FULL_41_10]OGE62427.1 MAG: hypothetical protein A2967_01255 [Candidatus Daviesbacteria bacterium RIFCSPLOWO2_01_FULL_41_32]
MSWLVVLIFIVLNEAIIEYLVGNIRALKPYIPLLSLAVAILLTFAFQISLFNVLLGTEIQSPFWEFLLSAFIISRLSNYLNDLVQKFLGSK